MDILFDKAVFKQVVHNADLKDIFYGILFGFDFKDFFMVTSLEELASSAVELTSQELKNNFNDKRFMSTTQSRILGFYRTVNHYGSFEIDSTILDFVNSLSQREEHPCIGVISSRTGTVKAFTPAQQNPDSLVSSVNSYVSLEFRIYHKNKKELEH